MKRAEAVEPGVQTKPPIKSPLMRQNLAQDNLITVNVVKEKRRIDSSRCILLKLRQIESHDMNTTI